MLRRDVCRVNALSAIDLLSRAVGLCLAITAEAADHRSFLQEFTDNVQCCYLQTEQNVDWGHHLRKKVTDFTTAIALRLLSSECAVVKSPSSLQVSFLCPKTKYPGKGLMIFLPAVYCRGTTVN